MAQLPFVAVVAQIHESRDQLRRRLLHVGEHVAVGVHGDADIRVSEPLLHDLGMDACP